MSKSHRAIVRIAALLVFPVLFIVEPAAAVEVLPSVTVRYHDLNLNNSEGVATLYGRIHNAANVVCTREEGPQLVNRIFWTAWNECFNHAIANAVNAVNNEKLSAYYLERIHGRKHLDADAPATVARQQPIN
jgi:UrcA family protein